MRSYDYSNLIAMHPHLSDVLVCAVYHGEICEEHAEVRYHSLHRATLEGGEVYFLCSTCRYYY